VREADEIFEAKGAAGPFDRVHSPKNCVDGFGVTCPVGHIIEAIGQRITQVFTFLKEDILDRISRHS